MLRAITSTNALNTEKYFTGDLARKEYYLDGVGRSEWMGKGAERLGLSGPVSREPFRALCQNRDPRTGEQLTPRMRADRRVGVDFNFHVPKSVSLVYAVGRDFALRDAVWMAASQAMRAMEPWVETRVRQDGTNADRQTGNLVWGQFLHETTRPIEGIPDPHLHAHCFAMNATYDETEGRWKAAQLGQIRENLPFFEAMFLSTLARRVEALGYSVRKTATAWEIDGIHPNTLALYCRRTAEIDAAAAARGVDDPREKARYGTYTRRPKSETRSMEEVERDWTERLSLEERHNLTRLKGKDKEFTTDKSLAEAVRYAVAKTFERAAVVKETALLTEILRACPGQMTVTTARAEFERYGVVVREKDGERLVTTKAVLSEEKRLVDLARDGRGQVPRLAAVRSFDLPGLSERERTAIWGVLQSADLVTVVHTVGSGQGGVLLRTMRELCGSELKRPFTVLSATGVGVRGEAREAGLKDVTTVAKLLSSSKLERELGRSVVWVSDAHKLSIKATADLIELVASRGGRVVLAADRAAHGATFRGSPIATLERHAGVTSFEVDTVRRHKGEYAEVVKALARGDLAEGVRGLENMGAVKTVSSSALFTEAAKELSGKMSSKARALIVAPTRAAVAEATSTARAELVASGKVRKERELTRLVRRDMTAADKARSGLYKSGMVVEFTKKTSGFLPREKWTVTGTNALGFVEVRKGMKLSTLPLRHTDSFNVFDNRTCDVGVGEVLRITQSARVRAVVDIPLGIVSKRHARPNRELHAGALHRVREFTVTGAIVLDNGFILPKSFGHFEYGYAATSLASVPHSLEHVVCVQPKDAGRAASVEQFARSVAMGTRSATVVTNMKSLTDLVPRRDAPQTGLDAVDGEFERDTAFRLRESFDEAAKKLLGVRTPSRELERTLER